MSPKQQRTPRRASVIGSILALGFAAGCSARPMPQAGVRATLVAPVAPPPTAAPTTVAGAPTTDEGDTTTTTHADPRSRTDRSAGVLSTVVRPKGTGQLRPVGGAAPAPNPGAPTRKRVSFLIEEGVDVDGPSFAAFAMDTLNDPRSWTRDGYTFEQVPVDGDIVITLASPATSEELCRPMNTQGTLSCAQSNRVMLTWYRWVQGQEDFRGDVTAYRRYVVNHEVGHTLGHGHEPCPRPGTVAPVMMQQTLGLKGCLPGPWPYPT